MDSPGRTFCSREWYASHVAGVPPVRLPEDERRVVTVLVAPEVAPGDAGTVRVGREGHPGDGPSAAGISSRPR
jgi:hypothetical protein